MTDPNEAKQAERPLRVVHQNERQRQHARYRIPARVRIGELECRVADWSIGGLALDEVPDSFGSGKTLELALALPFEGIEVSIDLHAQTVWHDPETRRAALRFVQLEERQLSSLRYVIDAYLSGEIVSTGDLIHVVGREPTPSPQRSKPSEPDPSAEQRRMIRIGAIALTLLVLSWFIVSSLYARLYTVEAVWAAVKAPVVVMRAPQASFFEPTELLATGRVGRGRTVALAELVGGGAAALDSPCDCSVVELHALPGEFVAQGEPLVTLLPDAGETFVRAQVAWEDLARVRRGDRAEMELVDGRSIEGTVSELRAGPNQDVLRAAPSSGGAPSGDALTEVTIIPDEAIGIDQLNEPVWVRIHTAGP